MTPYLEAHEKELERIKLAYEKRGDIHSKYRARCIGELIEHERTA